MKKLTKGLILVLCAAVLVAGSVMGTLAWLTDTKTISNTFTVGDIKIELKENDATNGVNDKLIPGTKVDINAKVTVKANSEECYLFVKVENNVAAVETKATDIANPDELKSIVEQMTLNGWTPLSEGSNIYYYFSQENQGKINATTDVVQPIFEYFAVRENANEDNSYSGGAIVVTAYAVQTSGFTSASQAWEQTFGASNQSQPNDQNSQ